MDNLRNTPAASSLGNGRGSEPLGLAKLDAPFSGRKCVVYSYEVSHESVYKDLKRPSEIIETQGCSGYGMIPCKIRTSGSDVRLFGFPILDEWPVTAIESPLGYKNDSAATIHLTGTTAMGR